MSSTIMDSPAAPSVVGAKAVVEAGIGVEAGIVVEARIGGRGVLESAFALLAALEQAGAAGVTRLAAECGLPKSTAHRLLEQLSGLGAVERSRGDYRIGARVFQLGHGWQPYPALRSAVREPMRRLAATTGVAVCVNVLRNGDDVIVDLIPGPDGPAAPQRRGATWPWTTASGKVQVANARGERGVSAKAPAGWRREAETIRHRGVAFDREDVIAGVCCAAVPVYSVSGVPTAALCVITDPAHNLDRLADVLKNAGRAASAALRERRAGV